MKIYKIMRLSDGLFSSGGMDPSFTKDGKTWQTISHVKNHLSQFKRGKWSVYEGCKLVTYDLVPSEDDSVKIEDIFDEYKRDAMVAKLKGLKWW